MILPSQEHFSLDQTNSMHTVSFLFTNSVNDSQWHWSTQLLIVSYVSCKSCCKTEIANITLLKVVMSTDKIFAVYPWDDEFELTMKILWLYMWHNIGLQNLIGILYNTSIDRRKENTGKLCEVLISALPNLYSQWPPL